MTTKFRPCVIEERTYSHTMVQLPRSARSPTAACHHCKGVGTQQTAVATPPTMQQDGLIKNITPPRVKGASKRTCFKGAAEDQTPVPA